MTTARHTLTGLLLARSVHYCERVRRTIAIAGVLGLAACDRPDSAPDDALVAADADRVLAAEVAQLRLYTQLRGIMLPGVAPAEAGSVIAAQIVTGVEADLEDPACLTAASDDATYVELVFAGCRHANAGALDGTIRLDFAAESGVCNGTSCVVAVDYTLAVTKLKLGQSRVDSAASTLHVLTGGGPIEYTDVAELPAPDERALAVQTEATWTIAAGNCVTADFGIEVVAAEHTINIGGRGLHACKSRCPEAGEVQLAWDAGSVIAWEYTGEGEIAVKGPHGRMFTLPALCVEL